ncbi:putative DNA binding domain-containing protein [Corynebacterium sp. TAE3-ERU12]|uniref:RNA-binding domain-containing protein n=1 Tax=Corynebacterium sp. TAE3-ERU12 TaxID=2849491 RepID=UPI001C45D9FA|nr:RNA-binding domain-containing protein [Corynebacterium sp. TAE3-ERU12]MBV7294745.1 putative DNA binding domain-containing protein [Corynebacterium sp. TAE3-ERU12]
MNPHWSQHDDDEAITPSLEELRTRPEDQWFERKSFRIEPKDLAKALVAFANTDGGIVVIGVEDRKLQGTASADQRNKFLQTSVNYTQPPVQFTYKEAKGKSGSGEPAEVIMLTVPPSEHVHTTTKNECFIRVGDSSQKLTDPNAIMELRYTKGERHYDATAVPNTSIADLDHNALEEYAAEIGSSSIKDALNARNLIAREGCIHTAGILMFGKAPQRFFPSAFIRVLKWSDPDRHAGRQQNLEEDERFEGSIPQQIADAQAFIKSLIPSVHRLGPGGKFVSESEIPPDAWLEGLVNAAIHRSYSMQGDHIRFEIFPDRLEISSPGRFPGLADPRKPESITRFARNPVIARIASELRIGQELGEGIRRIFQEMRGVGLLDPEYKQTNGSVILVMNAERRINAAQQQKLPLHADEVLTALQRANKPLGTGEVATLTRLSKPVARNALNSLRDADLVVWQGKSPRDPRATWSVRDAF